MNETLIFLGGLMIGGIAGMTTLALAMMAAASDRDAHELNED